MAHKVSDVILPTILNGPQVWMGAYIRKKEAPEHWLVRNPWSFLFEPEKYMEDAKKNQHHRKHSSGNKLLQWLSTRLAFPKNRSNMASFATTLNAIKDYVDANPQSPWVEFWRTRYGPVFLVYIRANVQDWEWLTSQRRYIGAQHLALFLAKMPACPEALPLLRTLPACISAEEVSMSGPSMWPYYAPALSILSKYTKEVLSPEHPYHLSWHQLVYCLPNLLSHTQSKQSILELKNKCDAYLIPGLIQQHYPKEFLVDDHYNYFTPFEWEYNYKLWCNSNHSWVSRLNCKFDP